MNVKLILVLLALCVTSQINAQPITLNQINGIEGGIDLLRSLKTSMNVAISDIVKYIRTTRYKIRQISLSMNTGDTVEEMLAETKEILTESNVEITSSLPCIKAEFEDIKKLDSDAFNQRVKCLGETSKILKQFDVQIQAFQYNQELENQYIDRVYEGCFTRYPLDTINVKDCFEREPDGCRQSVEKGILVDTEISLQKMKEMISHPIKNLEICANNVGEFINNRKLESIDKFQKCIDNIAKH